MTGIRISIVSCLVSLSGSALLAAGPSYFPLREGNSWAYRGGTRGFHATPQSIDIAGRDKIQDREYYRVHFLGRTLHLRESGETIYSFDAASRQEREWLRFDAAPGQSMPFQVDECTRNVRIESRDARISTPAGEWNDAVHLAFQGECADAGFTSMHFVRGVGPVAYETSSIAGPVLFALTDARAGDMAVEASQTAFTVALDAPRYQAAETVVLQGRLALRSSEPVRLIFPSSQRYDLRVWNSRGEIVYTWSADKLFAQVITEEEVGPGTRTFGFTAGVPNLPVGRYVAEAFLATRSREFIGTVGFEVLRDPVP